MRTSALLALSSLLFAQAFAVCAADQATPAAPDPITSLQWIGFGCFAFVAVWVICIVSYMVIRQVGIPDGAYNLSRWLCSVVSSLAALLVIRDANELSVKFVGHSVKGMDFTIDAAGAIAVFVMVFMLFPRLKTIVPEKIAPEVPPDRFIFYVPEGQTFKQALEGAAKAVGCSVDHSAFTSTLLATEVTSDGDVDAETEVSAFTQLTNFLPPPLNSFDVRFDKVANRCFVTPGRGKT